MSVIAEDLSRVTIGSPMQHGRLTLFPLLADGLAEPGYRLLDAALADDSARVTEVSESGSVPELCFVNDGDRPVLLLDGEELIGAKQNRILNLTILAPAHKSIVIPVSCVEQGRWQAQSTDFTSARRAHFATGRARKAADVTGSMRRSGSRESDQGAVWRDIAEKSRRFGVASATGAAADIYASRRASLEAYRNAFTPQPSQCGALFAVNGRLVGLDLFDSPVTLAAALGTLVESYALDALDVDNDAIADPAPDAPRAWLDAIAAADVEHFAALGEGEDWRLFGRGLAGGALVKYGRSVHLCVFAVDQDDEDTAEPGEGAARPGRLGLEMATDRRLIRRLGGSRRYLHLRLRVPRTVGTRLPLDLALVLDRSGSMGGGKWAQARTAAQTAIARLGSEDRVALVVFDEQVDTLLPLCRAHEAQAAAAQVLDGIGPRGGTDLAGGWLTGCGLIGRTDTAERLHRCFLLTGGHANHGIVDPAELARHAGALRQLGVVTGTFGVGDDYDEALLGALADAGGGAFHDIAQAETIVPVLNRELGDALEVVCVAPQIQLGWEADLQVEVLGPWRSTSGKRTLTIQPGDLVSDQVLDLLVAVRFPAGAQDTDCAVQVRVSDGEAILAQTRFDWTWVDSARRKAQPHDGAVEQRVGEMLASRARLAATTANRAGDLKQARAHLRKGAAAIRDYGADNPALRALAEALEGECEQHRTRQSPRALKERLYHDRNRQSGRAEDGGRLRSEPSRPSPRLQVLPAVDSPERAETSARLRAIPRQQTAMWGKATVTALGTGLYTDAAGRAVDWRGAVQAAVAAKLSLPPDAPLPGPLSPVFSATRIQVANETTLAAARRLSVPGRRVLALNFGNGIEPGGGFLQGNRGQESVLCRSSALLATLQGDAMYAHHKTRSQPDSTDWAILSPDVPVFRTDDGTPLEKPWLLSVITCAAPYAPTLGVEVSARLMESRIRRVLAVARAFGYEALVLGAWGCGTYGNDPARIAAIFHAALREQAGAFAEVVFSVTDGSPERGFFGPFADEFGRSLHGGVGHHPDLDVTAVRLVALPYLDSEARAQRCRADLAVSRESAARLGRSALEAIERGVYIDRAGQPVHWGEAVAAAVSAKRSLPPDAALAPATEPRWSQTGVQVANETTLVAAKRLTETGERVLALNFANGIEPGGGFLHGARAQEEVLCRSSALFATLRGDPMYEAHRQRPLPDSTDWAILSPDVPVFRTDDGTPLDAHWPLSFITCAAPYAPGVGQPLAGDLLLQRIGRVLTIARAHGYTALVLGAWGCGAFGNEPRRTAGDFHDALMLHAGAFAQVVFAVADWSPERRFLAPFADRFRGVG